MGPFEALFKSGRLLGIVLAGFFVASVIAPMGLGGLTGVLGIQLSIEVVAVVSAAVGLYAIGWLA